MPIPLSLLFYNIELYVTKNQRLQIICEHCIFHKSGQLNLGYISVIQKLNVSLEQYAYTGVIIRNISRTRTH
jgi:hypothetical protein